LRWAIIEDAPSTEPFAKPTLTEFDERILQDPELDEDAFFIAIAAAGSFVGMSNLWRKVPTGKRFGAGLTGVVRAYRRPGIATALKVRTIEYARSVRGRDDCDQPRRKQSDVHAEPQVGLEPKPAWISYQETVGAKH
jgi:GNAT superfamily N-acetyltransferase